MKPITSIFFLLFIALCLTFQPAISTPVNPSDVDALIVKACSGVSHKDYCINLLKSDTTYVKTNLKDIAFSAFKIAERNATDTSTLIEKEMQSTELPPEQQQGLSDCSDHYIVAVELIGDAVEALMLNAYDDVTKYAQAALTDIDACSASITNTDHIISQMNNHVRQIVYIAMSIAHVGVH